MKILVLVVQDLRYALRMMRRRRAPAVTAVIVLALGIGANAAMFSIVNKVLLEPLPYPESDRLVQLISGSPMGRAVVTSVPRYMTWRQGRVAFEHIAAFTALEPITLVEGGSPELASGVRVSADYFPVFGVRLALGRVFTADEDIPAAPPVVLISHGLWQRRFGRDPALVGRSVRIEGRSCEVVGVVMPHSGVDPRIDLWMPLRADPNSTDHSSFLQVVARLRPGVTLRGAHRQIYGLTGEFHRRFPSALGPREHFGAEPLRDVLDGDAGSALLFLLGAVTFVLLIACANVANLVLAQASERERELSLRTALGARPWRIVMQLMTESVLLSLAGGLAGLAIAHGGVRWLLTVNQGYLSLLGPAGADIVLDWRVLTFTMGLMVATTLLSGLYPAVHAARLDLTTMMGSSAQTGARPAQTRLRAALVIVQTACALVLLVGAGLLIRTFIATRTVEPGFVSRDVLALEMPVTGPRFARTEDLARLVRTAEQRVQVVADVVAVAAASSVPLEPGLSLPFAIHRRPRLRSPYHGTANWRRVSRAYFEVLRIPLLSGRTFTDHDGPDGLPVAIVNESMARKFWRSGSPLDERITLGHGIRTDFEEPSRSIVGVVGDVRDTGLNRDPEPMVYVPLSQVTDGMNAFHNEAQPLQWLVRTSAAPARLRAAIERELRASGTSLLVGRVRTMDDILNDSTARSDFNAAVLTLFAAIALVLAAVGIYGLMAYSIQQRTREIAVRMALGAEPWTVRGMVLMEGLRLTLTGVALGAAGAMALSRSMVSLIYGVGTWDPIVFAAVTALLCGVAIAAILLSARAATAIEPTEALRRA